MYKLREDTSPEWAEHVLEHFEDFLVDHAASERKAGAAAMHFAVRYHDKPTLIDTMLTIAEEEVQHFHQVFRLLWDRGRNLESDEKDPYASALVQKAHPRGQRRLLDRLLIGSISEYRGCERFALLSRHLEESDADPDLVDFYRSLAADDSRHRRMYYDMALHYFDEDRVEDRLDFWLDLEAEIVRDLPLRAALH